MVSYSSSGGGGTYSVSTAKGKSVGSLGPLGTLGSLPSMERITRQSAADDVLQRFVERAEKRRPPVDDSGVADLRWGEPSRFSLVQAEAPTNPSMNVVVGGGNGGEEEIPPEAVIYDYDEVQRQEEEIRVENPDDPDDYVIEARSLSITFVGRTDGRYIRLNLRYPV
jgi:CRISPR/Cas system CMR subunit Cmr4 (Cas7 group RAMP superfamily)